MTVGESVALHTSMNYTYQPSQPCYRLLTPQKAYYKIHIIYGLLRNAPDFSVPCLSTAKITLWLMKLEG